MAIRDPQTEWIRIQLYRQMTPQQRMWLAAQMYEDGVAIARSSILDRYPNISPEEMARQLRRRLLPRHLFEEVEKYLAEQK
ncbi:MAG: hypothetical protein NT075_15165 [Chloroflexi bacterium]|nr:hypothetical protein [Chloroflexota bacterium]